MSNITLSQQNQILSDQTPNNDDSISIQNDHNEFDLTQSKNDQPNSNTSEHILKSASHQETNNLEDICFKILKQCKICQNYIQVDEFDEHLNQCPNFQQKQNQSLDIEKQSTFAYSNSQNNNENPQDSTKVQELDKEYVEITHSAGGTEIKTIIKKDSKTGFTSYKTSYTKNKNNNEVINKAQEQINTQQANENLSNTNNQLPQNEQFNLNSEFYSTPQPEEEKNCQQCNKQFEVLDKRKFFDCGHMFHESCLQNQICPICPQEQQQIK